MGDGFFRYCQRNPKPCPLVGVSDAGDPILHTLGKDVDVRRDIGSYNVFRDGELSERVGDISDLWQDDMVALSSAALSPLKRRWSMAAFRFAIGNRT